MACLPANTRIFVTGFVIDDSAVWGRPVGVAMGRDGSLLFSEDGNGRCGG